MVSRVFVSVGMLLMYVCVFQVGAGRVVGCGDIPPLAVYFVVVLCIEVCTL